MVKSSKTILSRVPVLGHADFSQFMSLNREILMCMCVAFFIIGACLMSWYDKCVKEGAGDRSLCKGELSSADPANPTLAQKKYYDAGVVLITISAACAGACLLMQLFRVKSFMDVLKF
jgi:hypothetical protein